MFEKLLKNLGIIEEEVVWEGNTKLCRGKGEFVRELTSVGKRAVDSGIGKRLVARIVGHEAEHKFGDIGMGEAIGGLQFFKKRNRLLGLIGRGDKYIASGYFSPIGEREPEIRLRIANRPREKRSRRDIKNAVAARKEIRYKSIKSR